MHGSHDNTESQVQSCQSEHGTIMTLDWSFGGTEYGGVKSPFIRATFKCFTNRRVITAQKLFLQWMAKIGMAFVQTAVKQSLPNNHQMFIT